MAGSKPTALTRKLCDPKSLLIHRLAERRLLALHLLHCRARIVVQCAPFVGSDGTNAGGSDGTNTSGVSVGQRREG